VSEIWLARARSTTGARRARGLVRRAERSIARAGAVVVRAEQDGSLSPGCAETLERLIAAPSRGAARQMP